MTALDLLWRAARVRNVTLFIEVEGDVWTATLGDVHAGGFSCDEAAVNLAVKLIARSVLSPPQG